MNMMRHTLLPGVLLMVMALSTSIMGCSAEQSSSVTQMFAQAKATGKLGTAKSLAASTVTAQLAIFHLASALSQAASQDLDSNEITALSSGRSDTQVSYELDPDKGTGHVVGNRQGKTVIDLTFSFDRQDGNAGKAYMVTSTSGQVEGYQMFFPRLTFLYTAVLGNDFQPKQDEKGHTLFNVAVEAIGSFGIDGSEVMRLSKASYSLTYPLPEQEAEVGTLHALAVDGTSLAAKVFMTSKSFRLQGAIKDATGNSAYSLDTNPSGEVKLQKTESSSPAASI